MRHDIDNMHFIVSKTGYEYYVLEAHDTMMHAKVHMDEYIEAESMKVRNDTEYMIVSDVQNLLYLYNHGHIGE